MIPKRKALTRLDSSLLECARVGDVDKVKSLLLAGAEARSEDESGRQAIHLAALSGSVDCVGALAEEGGDARAFDDNGIEPVIYAVLGGNAECVKLLLDLGGSPDSRDPWGSPATHMAVCSGAQAGAILEALTEAGADLTARDRHGLEAIHWAAVMGVPEAGRMLVELGAMPDALDAHGRRPWETCGYKDPALKLAFRELARGVSLSDHPVRRMATI